MAETTLTKADVLAELRTCADVVPLEYVPRMAAIAAAVAGWCVVEGGHLYCEHDEFAACGFVGRCTNCGQRRAEDDR